MRRAVAEALGRITESLQAIFDKIDSFPALPNNYGADEFPIEQIFHHPSVYAPFGFKKKDLKLAAKTKLPASILVPTQEQLNREWVKKYVEHPPSELPLVVKYDGRFFATNHTRIAAQMLKGATMIDVRLVELDARGEYRRPEL